MEKKNNKNINIDVLKHIEDLSSEINKVVKPRAMSAFRRYPITFGLLILLGFILVNEGLKGVLRDMGLLSKDPWYLLVVGLMVLIITGTIYKKLEK